MKKSMLAVFTVLLFALLLCGPALADDDASWVQLTEKKYGFQTLFPEQPEEIMNKKNYGVGEVVNHVYTARENDQVFKVDFTQLPGMAVSFLGEADILDKTRNGILQKWLGKQISYTDATLGRLKGKKLTFETAATNDHPGMKGEARFFLKGHHLYVVETVLPKSQLPGNSEKFFKSFQIN